MALHPVGPLPASTYWRRRLLLLLALLVLVVVAKSCSGGGSGTPTGTTPSATPSPGVSRSAGPTPTVTRAASSGTSTCRDGVLRLTTRSETTTVKAGATARFTLTVTNTSSTTCRRDLGDAALELLVYSGQDRIWSSDDCAANAGSSVQTLAPGASLERVVSWPGTRSARGCPSPRPEARPGTYRLLSRVGTLQGTVTVFRLVA